MLEVIDVFETDDFAQNDYFPFILIQSGVKPIIDNIQIKELAKSISFFENADRIIKIVKNTFLVSFFICILHPITNIS